MPLNLNRMEPVLPLPLKGPPAFTPPLPRRGFFARPVDTPIIEQHFDGALTS